MKTVHLIRHGETEQNVLKVWQGHTDTPLNKNGLRQAKLLALRLKDSNATVYSSNLKRASETASFLSKKIELRETLREINVGDFTGMPVGQTYSSNNEIFQSLQDDSYQFPNGETVKEFNENACVIVKHNNPCGVAEHSSLLQAYIDARDCDPVSAFGGIVAFNNKVEKDVADEIVKTFIEVLVAPGYSDEALEIFKSKPNLRVLVTPDLKIKESDLMDIKKVVGGILYQDADRTSEEDFIDFEVATKRAPTDEEIKTLLLAWKVCKNVKSNAIVLARGNKTVGIGAGQMNRVNSVQLAKIKSKDHYGTKDSSLASDAFFPFRDGVDEAAKAGVTAIVQPGGSIRDEEVIQAANENNIAMIFVGVRHFKH